MKMKTAEEITKEFMIQYKDEYLIEKDILASASFYIEIFNPIEEGEVSHFLKQRFIDIQAFLGCDEPKVRNMKFFIKIEIGNDAMDSHQNLANAIKKVAERIESEQYDIHPDDEYEIPIVDENGNTVGKWGFGDLND
jgi:hypothetical protein